MKKQTTSRRPKRKKAVGGVRKKVAGGKGSNMRKKVDYNREVETQMRLCDEFMEHPNRLLGNMATILDTKGATVLGDNAKECIDILDTVREDLDTYEEELIPLKNEALEFIENNTGDSWEWTMGSITICEAFNSIRGRYIALFDNNYMSLRSLLGNSKVLEV